MTRQGYDSQVKVWEKFPSAQSRVRYSGGTSAWFIDDLYSGKLLGIGNTESAAWADALRHIGRAGR